MPGYSQTQRTPARESADGGAAEQQTAPMQASVADGLTAALNQSPRSHSLMQLRAALDGGPPVQAQLVLQRALNDTAPVQKRRNTTGLPDRLKAGVETLSGLALDDVRVHYKSSKPAALQAHAYTQGNEIHVAPGQEQHLPHEAWHAVQQKQGRVKPTLQMKGVAVSDDAALEREADIMGSRGTRTAPSMKALRHGRSAPTVQRMSSQNDKKSGGGAQQYQPVPQYQYGGQQQYQYGAQQQYQPAPQYPYGAQQQYAHLMPVYQQAAPLYFPGYYPAYQYDPMQQQLLNPNILYQGSYSNIQQTAGTQTNPYLQSQEPPKPEDICNHINDITVTGSKPWHSPTFPPPNFEANISYYDGAMHWTADVHLKWGQMKSLWWEHPFSMTLKVHALQGSSQTLSEKDHKELYQWAVKEADSAMKSDAVLGLLKTYKQTTVTKTMVADLVKNNKNSELSALYNQAQKDASAPKAYWMPSVYWEKGTVSDVNAWYLSQSTPSQQTTSTAPVASTTTNPGGATTTVTTSSSAAPTSTTTKTGT
jgi:hypothetical protein